MGIYKLYKNTEGSIVSVTSPGGWSVPFDPANTDYQQFKQAINDDTAQLEDADGVVMSPDEAKTFVATLP